MLKNLVMLLIIVESLSFHELPSLHLGIHFGSWKDLGWKVVAYVGDHTRRWVRMTCKTLFSSSRSSACTSVRTHKGRAHSCRPFCHGTGQTT